MARKNSRESQEPRKKPREEPGYVGWPVLFWLCRVEIITVHGQDVQTFIDDQHGQIIIIITVVVVGAWYCCFWLINPFLGVLEEAISDGATVSPDPACLSLQYLCCSSLCVGGLGSVCYIWSTYPVLSGVLCEFKYALSNSLFLSLSRRT